MDAVRNYLGIPTDQSQLLSAKGVAAIGKRRCAAPVAMAPCVASISETARTTVQAYFDIVDSAPPRRWPGCRSFHGLIVMQATNGERENETMRMKILVVDSDLLSSRTLAMMYEVYECEVTLASDVETAVDAVNRCPIDVLVMGQNLYRQNGAELRAAIKAIRPGLCIAAIRGPQDMVSGEARRADIYLRPTHFFTDLYRHMSFPP